MKRSVMLSVVAIVAATVLVFVAAGALLRTGDEAGDSSALSGEPSGESCPIDAEGAPGRANPAGAADGNSAPAPPAVEGGRPECPAGTIGGVDLPCLGGTSGTDTFGEDEIVVASVWAWWCEPCREELPALAAFAERHPEYTVVGVHADKNAGNGVEFLNDIGVDLPSYQDESGEFSAALGLPPVVPVLVVFRGEQRLATIPKPFTSADDIAKAVAELI